MRSFYIVIVIWLLLILVIIGNTVFVSQTAKSWEARIGDMPQSEEAIATLETDWQKKKTLLGLGVPEELIREIGDRLTELKGAVALEQAEFETARQLLLQTVRRLREGERLSIGHLLLRKQKR